MHSPRNYLSGLLFLAAVLITSGCNREPPLSEPPPVEVVISHPVEEKIQNWDVYTGTVDSKESVEVRSRVRGEIKEVRFKEGEEIAAGAELFLIDKGPFEADLKQAEGQLASYQAKLKLADEKLTFYKPLAEKGTVSKEELLKVIADKDEALGGIDTAKGKILDAQLNIGYCKITSPIAGKVGEAVLTKGNQVNSSGADSLLTTVVGVDPMYVIFYVNQRALQGYREILLERAAKDPESKEGKLQVPVEMAIGDDEHFAYKGVVDFVDNRVDPATSSIKVRAKFDNPKQADGRRSLTPGLFARVRVSLTEPTPAILVTDRAILTDQNLNYVLVVNRAKNNVVERVDITASPRVQPDGLKAVQGLDKDAWVIVDGMNRVRP